MDAMDETILIIGAGPVGLSLAMALVRQGIKVEVFEQGPKIVKEIRASTFHPATMEKMAEWGVLNDVLACGYRVDHLQFWDRHERRIVGDFDYGLIAGDTEFPFRLQCPQHLYAEALLAKLQNEPLASIYFEHEFIGSREIPAGAGAAAAIEATFRTPVGTRTRRGQLLCGADGANSLLRRSLHLSFEGMTYEDRFLLIGTDLRLADFYPGMAPVSYIFDPEEWVITLQLNDLLRVVFQVKDQADAEVELSEANIRQRMAKFLGKTVDFPILTKSIYRVHQRVAETFRVGRRILLGDAAHINNPASGMGMNSGILDAACLAEKIREYLDHGQDAPLDAYSAMRRTYALDKIESYTKQRYHDMSASDLKTRQERNQQYHAISHDPTRARSFLLKAAMLEHRI